MASVNSFGQVSYHDDDGNLVVIDTQEPIAVPEEGSAPSLSPTAEAGTDSFPSSSTPKTSESSTDTGSLSPAPTMENLSEADPTASGTASSTDGAGTDSPTSTTESSDQQDSTSA